MEGELPEARPVAEGSEIAEPLQSSGAAEDDGDAVYMNKANFRAQTNALMRKSGILQCRSWKTTCCLVISPFFFCILIFVLQLMLNIFVLDQPGNKCGCLCLSCCYWDDSVPEADRRGRDPPCYTGDASNPPAQCTPANRGGDLLDECKAYDLDTCGSQYSTIEQLPWCAIPHPTPVPTYLQVPQEPFRAEPLGPNATVLFTGDDAAVASSLADKLLLDTQGDLFASLGVLMKVVAELEDSLPGGASGAQVGGTDLSGGFDTSQILGMVGGGTDSLVQPLVTAGILSTEEADLLAAAIATPGMVETVLGSVNMFDAMTDSSEQQDQQIMLDIATGDSSNPIVGLLANITALISRQNTLGTSQRSPLLYFIEPAMAATQYVMRTECAAPIPAPFNSTPFNYECLSTHMVEEASAEDINQKLFCGWKAGKDWIDCPESNQLINAYVNAFDFKDTAADAGLNVDVWFNASGFLRGGDGGPGDNHRMYESMNSVANSFLRLTMDSDAFHSVIMAVKEMPKLQSTLNLDFASILGPLFFMLVLQLLFPVMLQQLVYEKHNRLRIMMKMHGLSDGVYWLVTYVWYLVLSIVYFLILIIFGSAIGLKFFTLTDYGVMIVFLLVFSNTQISLAFLLSTLVQNPKTAVTFGFVYSFSTSFMANFLLANLAEQGSSAVIYLELLPAFSLFRGLYEISNYSFMANYQGSVGLTFAKFSDEGNGMVEILVIMLLEFPIFMSLAWYLEQVLGQVGTRKHWLFCFGGKRAADKHKVEVADVATRSPSGNAQARISMDPEDVQEERLRVTGLESTEGQSIVLKDLKKVYPPQGGKPAKTACRALTMAVERGECFGLLGPNGAGKSTSINMMVGFLTPSSGTAFIEGLDILQDMDKIYPMMGVCPQHDLLWETMTAREHLLFYGRLKNLKGQALLDAADKALKSVNLFNNGVGNKKVRTYSGGMKRRLSVAISLIGDPRVVYLDEPSTGLDPASRRNLWDVIKQAKQGRAIILTTHSMEEAEVLCDRLGIFVDGQLQCIGNPKELTARYGGYLVFTITTKPEDVEKAKEAVMQLCPDATPTYHLAGTQKFEMPSSSVSVSDVFSGMVEVRKSVDVLDWGVANASLEEVFVKVALQGGDAEYL